MRKVGDICRTRVYPNDDRTILAIHNNWYLITPAYGVTKPPLVRERDLLPLPPPPVFERWFNMYEHDDQYTMKTLFNTANAALGVLNDLSLKGTTFKLALLSDGTWTVEPVATPQG